MGRGPSRIFLIKSGMTWARPGSSSGSSPGPYALNGRAMAKGVPYCSWKARQYHSPTSFENPYAENGGGQRSMASSGVGNSPARSNTMDEETYTTFDPASVAVRNTEDSIRLFSSRMSAG